MEAKVGRADPARSAHFSAEWRCGCVADEKMKIRLRLRESTPGRVRRVKVKWAGRGGPALTVGGGERFAADNDVLGA